MRCATRSLVVYLMLVWFSRTLRYTNSGVCYLLNRERI
nr:MAG TPA: hypothetical protein [Caudoviricetes sp.]